MSYRANIYLKQFNNEGDAVVFANKVSNVIMSYSEELLKSNLFAIPEKDINNPYPYWLYAFYNFKFVYFKEANVLSLIGDYGIAEVSDMFDTHFYFQNSCDQDYDYELWDDKIFIFKELKAKIQSLSDIELVDEMINDKSTYYNENDREDIINSIDYYRKTYLYEIIANNLGVIDFIYDKESNKYNVFVINGIKSQHQFFQLCKIFHKVTEPLKAELEELDDEIEI